jgi:hypothetical protein
MSQAFWNIGLVLVATVAGAICLVVGRNKQLGKTGTRDRALAFYAFGAGCLLLAITGLVTVGPWLSLVAAFFFIIGAWRLQREKVARSLP